MSAPFPHDCDQVLLRTGLTCPGCGAPVHHCAFGCGRIIHHDLDPCPSA